MMRGRVRLRLMNASPIGQMIRDERLRRGWSLAELADLSGQLGQTISAIELGVSKRPHITTVKPITDALGISWSRASEALLLEGTQRPANGRRRGKAIAST